MTIITEDIKEIFYKYKDKEDFRIKDLKKYYKKKNEKIIKFTLYTIYCRISKLIWKYQTIREETGLPNDIIFKILVDF